MKKKKKINDSKVLKRNILISILVCFGLFVLISAFPTIVDVFGYPDGLTTSNSSIVFNYSIGLWIASGQNLGGLCGAVT